VATIPSPSRLSLGRALLLGGIVGLLALGLMACAQVGSPQGWMPPTALDGAVLLTLKAGKLVAVDMGDWRVRWEFPGPEDKDVKPRAFYGAPVVAGSLVYVGGYDGTAYALDKENGRLRWRFETKGAIIGGLALAPDAGLLLVPSDDGRLYGLDAAEGTLRPGWPFRTGKGIWSRPAVEDDTVYVGSLDGKVYALEVASGRERWHLDLGAGVISDPALARGLLLVGATDRRLYAIDVRTGRLAWKTPFRADNWFWAQPLVAGEAVYAANLDGGIYALSLADGSLRWRFMAQEPVRARPLLMGDVLVVVDRSGNVYGLDPDTGEPRWGPVVLQATVLANPLPLEGRALLLSQDGGLFLVDPATGEVETVSVRP